MVSPTAKRTSGESSTLLTNESGQAVIEYMLVLTITVMLILTAMYQFSTAFRVYTNNFFGEYIACLMETGELPGSASCSVEFKDFNLADGTTAGGGSTSGGTGSGGSTSGSNSSSGSGTNGTNGKNGKDSGKTGSSKSNSNSSSASSSSTAATGGETLAPSGSGNGVGNGRRGNTRMNASKTTGAGGKDANSGKGREGLTALGNVSNSNSNNGSSQGRRTALGRGFSYVGQEEDEEKISGRPATKPVAKDESGSLKPKKVAVQPPRAPATAGDADSEGFTFGNLLRWLLIGGILIAIFILFGGQLLAISKGGEK